MVPRHPNIVFILVDDMGYGDFSRFNEGLTQTPRLDALMDEGVTLDQHYTGSPVCNPSRACLMTGRYPHRTGSIDTLEWHGLERLALREITLADMLRQAGYRTGLFGKWHLGAFDPRYHPMARGFDEAVCFRGGMHDYYQWRVEFGRQPKRGDGKTYLTDLWTKEACAFIDRHAGGDRPFFCHVTYNAPHTPLQAPAEDIAPFRDSGDLNPGVQTLYGMLRRLDRGVEQLLECLKRNGAEDNTIIVFSSDNGPQFGGPPEMNTTRFNCHLHGAKGSTYDGGVRVPGIIRWPDGGIAGGKAVSRMVHMSDWFPTLLAAAGLEPPTDRVIDGVNVLPVLRGEDGDVCTRRFWQWNRYTPVPRCNAGMRDGDWKLIQPKVPEAFHMPEGGWLLLAMYGPEYFEHYGPFSTGYPPREIPADRPTPELYNLAEDPLEQNDLAEADPDRVSRMCRDIEQWFEEVEAERATIDDDWWPDGRRGQCGMGDHRQARPSR